MKIEVWRAAQIQKSVAAFSESVLMIHFGPEVFWRFFLEVILRFNS